MDINIENLNKALEGLNFLENAPVLLANPSCLEVVREYISLPQATIKEAISLLQREATLQDLLKARVESRK